MTTAKGAHASLRLWLRLLDASNTVEREVRSRLRGEFSITLPRFDVLAQLDADHRDGGTGLAMSELSRRLMVTNGNLTGLVESLAQEGLVTRTASPTDRRSQIVRLTATGRRAVDRMTARHERWIEELFGGMRRTEVAELHALLDRLRDSVQRDRKSEVNA